MRQRTFLQASLLPRSLWLSLLASVAATACGDDSPAGPADPGFSFPDGSPAVAFDGSVADAYVPNTWDSSFSLPDAGSDAQASGDGAVSGDGGSDGSVTPATGVGLEGTPYTPYPTTGKPLDEAVDGKWTYIEFPDTSCRDGSKAGITVFRNKASKKVMFFFDGGGACFDSFTCGTNPANIGDSDKAGPTGGLFNRTKAENPVKDWNFVYFPYCTGDVFAGTRQNVTVEGVTGSQQFVGYLNTQKFLQRIGPTFADSTDILVTGISAGGFGASASVVLLQRAFPNVKGKLIDDSGPPMSSKVVTTCLQKKWRETWGLDESMLKDCGAGCPNKDDYNFAYGLHLSKVFNNRLSGLIETTADLIISRFFGIGRKNFFGEECKGDFLLTPVPAPEFKAGLLEFREAVQGNASFGTFFPPGDKHTWLAGDDLYTAAPVDGVKMIDWVSDIINGKGTKHVGGN